MAADILIVDDEADIRELMAGILQDEGYQTREAADSKEALARIPELRAEFWKNVKVSGESGSLNQDLEVAGRVADFFEAKLQRSLDKVVAVVGPLAIISISIVVGGLIVSVMTALLSISQIVG